MPNRVTLQEGFEDVNGTRLHYEQAGAGTPVVFIHGFSLDLHMWDDQFAPLSEHYHAVRYDLRGFGQSAVPSEEMYGHEADLKALLDHLNIQQPAHIVALSLGGMVAIDFALTYPAAVRTFTLADALFAGFHFTGTDAGTDTLWETAREKGIPAAKQEWIASGYFKPLHEQPTILAKVEAIVSNYSGWHFLNNNPAVSPEPRADGRLGEIKVPTLIVIGERDISDFRKMADIMEQQIPGAHKIVLPRVGHMSNMEAADRFNEIVLAFLAKN